MLCLLEGELDQGVFSTLMSQFVTYWSAKEPDFVKLTLIGQVRYFTTSNAYTTCLSHSTEEWAKSYRLFEHDTNMFLERYITYVSPSLS